MYSELSGKRLTKMDEKRSLGKLGLDTSQYVREGCCPGVPKKDREATQA
jgi:hypothetical protein